ALMFELSDRTSTRRIDGHAFDTQVDPFNLPIQRFHQLRMLGIEPDDAVLGKVDLLDKHVAGDARCPSLEQERRLMVELCERCDQARVRADLGDDLAVSRESEPLS